MNINLLFKLKLSNIYRFLYTKQIIFIYTHKLNKNMSIRNMFVVKKNYLLSLYYKYENSLVYGSFRFFEENHKKKIVFKFNSSLVLDQ